MMAFLIVLLHSLAKSLTFLDCPAASKISAKLVNSTLSIAFAGVRNALDDEMQSIRQTCIHFGQALITHQIRLYHPKACGGFQPCLHETGQTNHGTSIMRQDVPVNAFGSPLPSLSTAGEGEPGPPVQL